MFETDHQLFEVTMSACSGKEEAEWRRYLLDHISNSTFGVGEEAATGLLVLNVKTMGTVFGKPGKQIRTI